MTARYRLSADAQHDLDEIRQYTNENWGAQQAKQYLIELALKFEQLAASPARGRPRNELGAGVRSFRARHHIVFYRFREPDEPSAGIDIARVLHPSRDIDVQFTT